MLKKTTAAALGLAATGFAFAGSMGPVCAPGNLTVPCEAKQWSFGLDALYLKAVDSGTRAYREFTAAGALAELDEGWNWGFRASGAYQYSTGKDATVTWLHYSNAVQQSGFSGLFTPLALTSNYAVASNNRLEQVNAVLGQHVDVTTFDKVRFYTGLQYVGVAQNETNYYPISFLSNGLAVNYTTYYDKANFRGAGPVIGIDYTYYVSPQISLLANGATSLLYGTTRMSTGYVLAPINLVNLPTYLSRKITTPGFEAKLGVNYAYSVEQGVLNIQGGYRVVDYFSMLQTNSLQSSTASVTAVDYALYGPYVGLKYVGHV